jgi:2-dehydro-3-deoxygalactonokinase
MMAGDDNAANASSVAFERGVERGLDGGSIGAPLLHDIFGARTLALCGELMPDESADYLSGLLIGNEIREGRAWANERGAAIGCTVLIGAPALTERYMSAFALSGVETVARAVNAAAHGLWRLAQQARLTVTPRSLTV